MSLTSFVESFVPADATDKQEIYRARIFVYSMFSLGCFGMTYNLIYYRVGNWVAGTAILCEASLVWFMPWIFKRTRNLKATTHWFALSYSVMMTIIMASSGGYGHTANPWWAISPVFVTLVLGLKAGRTWLIVALGVLAAAYGLEQFGLVFPNLISTAPEDMGWVNFLLWFHFFGCVLMLSLSAVVFDFINRDAMNVAARNLNKAKDASEIAEEQNQYLAESVARILKKMEKLEHGDLTVRLAHLKDDEIGSLCDGFNSSVTNINKAICEVSEVVSITTQSSEKINMAASELASGTEQQTEKANEINQAVANLVAGISQNAQSAQESSDAAKHNGEVARNGGEVVQKTVQKIEEIASVVNQAADSIGQLANSSREIGEIVSVIQDIANRTNLLALNASIEAAHAGAAGAGFGVIANEVKELAGQTAKATEQITHMIKAVQSETQEVINDMQSGNDQVREGKELAGQAGAALDEIVESSANLTNIVEEISQSCAHQSEQGNWFLDQVRDMSSITETSANKINDIAASTGELDQLTARINEEMGRFKTQETV